MGFSGGGSNVLKNHKHDATVVQDGGSLDADNVTSADLTAGDIIYSDGVHLQRLAIGTPTQQIQVNAGATAPEYFTAAAGSAAYEEVGTTELGADATSCGLTFASISADDIASLEIFYGGRLSNTGTDCNMRINNVSTGDYNTQYNQVTAGAGSIFQNTSGTEIRTSPNCRQIYGHISFQAGTTAQAATYDTFIQYEGTQSGKDLNALTTYAGYLNNGGSPTTATSFTQFDISVGGGTLRPGFFVSVFKINRT